MLIRDPQFCFIYFYKRVMNGGGLLLVPYSDSDASNGASDAEDAEDSAAQKRSKRRRVEGTGRFPAVAGNWQTHIRILCKGRFTAYASFVALSFQPSYHYQSFLKKTKSQKNLSNLHTHARVHLYTHTYTPSSFQHIFLSVEPMKPLQCHNQTNLTMRAAC